MNKAPSFQWYPKDCDTDETVRLMDDEQFGCYVRCLNHAWLNHGLPSDLQSLRRLFGGGGSDEETTYERREDDGQTTRKRRDRFNRIWKVVGVCFVLDDETGRLVNLKQELQRKEQKEFSESRRRAAKSKWNAHAMHVHQSCNAKPMQVECSASPSPTAYKETPLTPLSDPDAFEDQVERLYARHPKKKNKPLVVPALFAALQRATFVMIDAAHEQLCRTADWTKDGGKWAPKLDEWLVDDGWTAVQTGTPRPTNYRAGDGGDPYAIYVEPQQ